jgi:3-hydroxyisobutyrate dehydrogenase-like beta-hydroxyacid dehydrogenase
MDRKPSIGFIGFGEAGSSIAKGLKAAGLQQISAYDINRNSSELGPRIQTRAKETETTLVDTPEALTSSAGILISTVTCDRAIEAAEQTVRFLESRHIYADLNSVSPAVKQSIDKIITASGAGFVEAAVMSPVPPYGHRAPMLIGGSAATKFAELMTPYEMRLEILPGAVGAAAATKMFRSIVMKGMEALVLECVLAASRYNAEGRVFASLSETFPGMDWEKLADYMVGRVVVHGERRAHEMKEVSETLRSMGIEPIMAEATARRQEWCARLGVRSRFDANGPQSYRDALRAIAEATDAGNMSMASEKGDA